MGGGIAGFRKLAQTLLYIKHSDERARLEIIYSSKPFGNTKKGGSK